MIGNGIALLVVVWAAFMMVARKFKPQPILLIAGLTLLFASVLLHGGPVLDKKSTGSTWLDVFQLVADILGERTGGSGMAIMAIAGFGAYMEHVGASKALFALVGAPLGCIRSPYVLLVGAFLVTQVLVLFIPSHTGLGLLLMATMYPILIRLGVTPLSALAVIGCNQFIDHGPCSMAEIYASTVSGLDPVTYFVKYQLPVSLPIIAVVAGTHFFIQRFWDRTDGCLPQTNLMEEKTTGAGMPPLIYAVLPVVPFGLVLVFSPVFNTGVKMDIITAMIISGGVALCFEYCRLRNLRDVLESLTVFFNGMGRIFASVVTLIVSGETFGAGLVKIGAIDSMIQASQTAGFGVHAMVVVLSLVLAASAFVMGSGNAAFFSFAKITPKIAAHLGVDTVTLLLPMQIMTSFGRTVSPIAPPIVSIAAMAGVPPLQLVKRTAVPMAVAGTLNIVLNFLIFVK
jgi:DcuC family C4-dicarboxylate transporter